MAKKPWQNWQDRYDADGNSLQLTFCTEKTSLQMAQFPQNQAKAEISIYRQFAWVNCVKYKRNQGVHLRGDTGRLIQLKIPF